MHDLSLGPPVDVGIQKDAKHSGSCNDGVYRCSWCWNADNEGKGTISICDCCKKQNVHTKVRRAWDEPVMYAACEACSNRVAQAEKEEIREEEARYALDDYRGDSDEDEEDDDPIPWQEEDA